MDLPGKVSATDGFFVACSNSSTCASSRWYEHLKRNGSCLKLYDLLANNFELIHELGPKGITVLHKGVQHGCVQLVRYTLVDVFDEDGKCKCREHGAENSAITREGLLRKICDDGSTAVNMAVVSGSPKMILMLEWAIDMSKVNNGNLTEMSFSEKESYNVSTDQASTSIRRRVVNIEDTRGIEMNLEFPKVADYSIDRVYEKDWSKGARIPEVFSVMKQVLEEDWGTDQEMMDLLKEGCRRHVDFEFVPVSHVFLHFLFTLSYDWRNNYDTDRAIIQKIRNHHYQFADLRMVIVKRVVELCRKHDLMTGRYASESMVVALFNMLDPRGRTILHAGYGAHFSAIFCTTTSMHWQTILCADSLYLSAEEKYACWNAKDGAGRTILHLHCIYNNPDYIRRVILDQLDWNVKLTPLCDEFYTLQNWCFPNCASVDVSATYRPLHYAALFNSDRVFEHCLPHTPDVFHLKFIYRNPWCWDLFQITAFFGRSTLLELMFKQPAKFNIFQDSGFGNKVTNQVPAIHCAAMSGQVKVLEYIHKLSAYDPLIQNRENGTALHILLEGRPLKHMLLEEFNALALLHVYPSSYQYERIKDDFKELQFDPTASTMFTTNEMTSINLLLQAGIDIWTPAIANGEAPIPGSTANDEARAWWYGKVVKEVVNVKTEINNAANATSVVAALVATASFIGPLQPPLSYNGDGNHIDTSVCAVRVYVVCISLSFYLSIASLLMGVIPVIPMPKESTFDELFRSQRCLRGATLMLLGSLICILIGFSSASWAVVSSKQHDIMLVASCTLIGATLSIVVLVMYIVRMLRMFFHTNDKFRRWFATKMYF